MKIVKYSILMLVFAGFASCTHQHPEKENDAHNHDEKLVLTAYSEEYEIFAEATPFSVGEESEILTHISLLENFKPLAQGTVTASLVVGADSIGQTLDKAVRKGIYQFSLKPVVAGKGHLSFRITTTEGSSTVFIENIEVFADEHEAQHAAADAEIDADNGIVFTKEQSWKIDFATAQAKREPFGQMIKTTAQILPAQGDAQIVTAKMGGIVRFQDNNIVEGRAVSAGQGLFSIDGSGTADNNLSVRYSEAQSEYNKAKIEYERKKELAKDRIVSESELLNAKTEFSNAEAVYNNLRKNFASGKQTITSPMSGFITQLLVQNGEYVEAGKAVLMVSQNKELLIKAEVQSRYLPMLPGIVSANIHVMNTDKTYTLQELNGKILSFGKSADEENPLIPVMFRVKNSVGLLPGSFVEMYIKTQTNQEALTVPKTAIVEEMGNYFVFVQLTPELFEKRLIEKGVTDGINTEILSGISESERVVSKGATLVKLAQAAGELDAHAGHAH